MILPLVFLIATLGACTSDSDCKFGSSSATAQPIPQGLGVNIHFTEPKPGEIKMIADAGFRWVRMDFKWNVTERERGRYDFAEYDRLMKGLDEYKLRALFILDYGNPLYDNAAPPRTAETRHAFALWATAAAKHFANRGVIWEIYNEANNAMFWPPKPNAGEYVELSLAVGRAFRAELPDEKLIGPAVSTIDVPFLDACFKGGLLDYWYAVSIHPYRQTDPETAALEYCRLRKLIDAYRSRTGSNRAIPIVSGEWGYSSVWRGMTEEKQSAQFAREMLTNFANEISISIWYDWRDDGSDPNEAEHHFGLVRNAYRPDQDQVFEPKPAYQAAKTFSQFFDGYVFSQRLSAARDDDYILVFTKAGEQRYAIWTTAAATHRMNIPTGTNATGEFKVTRHTGEPAGSVTASPAGISIEATNQPLYLSKSQ
jgi:hypothetical protein